MITGLRGLMPVAVLAAALLLGGCTAHRPIVGRDISTDHVRTIVPQMTTDREVVQWFGTPDSLLHYPDGSQEYRYSYTGWVDHRVPFLVYTRTTTEKEHKSLTVRVQEGVVTGMTYTNTAQPGDNVTR